MSYCLKQQHPFAVEFYFRTGNSVIRVQREFQKHFNTALLKPVPNGSMILNWIKNVRRTANRSNKKLSNWPRSAPTHGHL